MGVCRVIRRWFPVHYMLGSMTMKPVTSTALFATALLVALLCVSLIEIYVFAHFEGAIGTPFDNLKVSGLVDAAISLIAALGFAAALYWRRSRPLPIRNAANDQCCP